MTIPVARILNMIGWLYIGNTGVFKLGFFLEMGVFLY